MNGADLLARTAGVVAGHSLHLALVVGPVLLPAGLLLSRWPAARHALCGLVLGWLLWPAPLASPWALAPLGPSGSAPAATSPGPWALVWLCGASGTGALLWRRRRALRRAAENGRPVDGLAVPRSVRVVAGEGCFTLGLRPPIVVLPEPLLAAERPVLDAVVAHELAHVERRDDLRVRLELVVRALYFFHPVVWLVLAWREADRERLCDRRALRQAGLAPLAYGRGLLQALRLGGAPAVASGLGPRHGLSRRVRELVDGSATRPQRPLPALALALAVATALLPESALGESPLLRLPVLGARLTAAFGPREDPLGGGPQTHHGIDLGADRGRPVVAAAPGIVEEASEGDPAGRGRRVVVRHGAGLRTVYEQLESIAVPAGTPVRAGDRLGAVGASGRSTGPHLHFEVWQGGRPVDPLPLLGPGAARP